MEPLSPGSSAPKIDSAQDGTKVAIFFKINCPVCQMAAPKFDQLEAAYPGRTLAIGQDSEADVAGFADRFGMTSVPMRSDLSPYALSDSFGVRVVPTMFLLGDDDTVVDVAESWDRDGFLRITRLLAEATDAEFVPLSEEGDGLPAFRPG